MPDDKCVICGNDTKSEPSLCFDCFDHHLNDEMMKASQGRLAAQRKANAAAELKNSNRMGSVRHYADREEWYNRGRYEAMAELRVFLKELIRPTEVSIEFKEKLDA